MERTRQTLIDIPVDPILKHLVDTYPRLFHGSTPRSHSFVQPGWKAIVDALCLRIDGMLTDKQASQFAVRQIKDKLGTLRLYFSFGGAVEQSQTERDSTGVPEMGVAAGGDRSVETAGKIRAAIEEGIICSSNTCSVCSKPGRIHHLSGLLSVRCEDHSSVRGAG